MSSIQALATLLSLMRAISHQIRTPLSVISNDLVYFKSLIDPAECERGISKCRQISDLFKPFQLLEEPGQSFETFELQTLLLEIFADRFENPEYDMLLTGSRANLKHALTWLSEIFRIETVSIIKESLHLTSSILFSLGEPLPIASASLEKDVFSVTEIFAKQANDDSILPMLIDAVFFSFSAQLKIAERSIELIFQ